MSEKVVINGVPGVVTFIDAKGEICEAKDAVWGEAILENGDRVILTVDPPDK